MTEFIGWFAAAVLLATIGRQVYTQWRDGSTKGLSRWLFIGQMTASLAFIVYSWQVRNWVFVVSNAMMLGTAILGEWILLANRRRSARSPQSPSTPSKTPDLESAASQHQCPQ